MFFAIVGVIIVVLGGLHNYHVAVSISKFKYIIEQVLIESADRGIYGGWPRPHVVRGASVRLFI